MFSFFKRKKKGANPKEFSGCSGKIGELKKTVGRIYKRHELEKAMTKVYAREGRKKPEFLDMPAELQTKIAELCNCKDPENLRLSCRQLNDIYVASEHNLEPPTTLDEKVEVNWCMDDPYRTELIVKHKKSGAPSKCTTIVKPEKNVLKKFLHLATALNIEAGDELPKYLIENADHLKKFLATCRVKSVVIACHNAESIGILIKLFPESVRFYFHARHDNYMEEIPFLERFCGVNNLANGVSLNVLESLETNKNMPCMVIYLKSFTPLIAHYLEEWENKERDIHIWNIYIEEALDLDLEEAYLNRYYVDKSSEWLACRASVTDGVTFIEISLCAIQNSNDVVWADAEQEAAANQGRENRIVFGKKKMERSYHVIDSEDIFENPSLFVMH